MAMDGIGTLFLFTLLCWPANGKNAKTYKKHYKKLQPEHDWNMFQHHIEQSQIKVNDIIHLHSVPYSMWDRRQSTLVLYIVYCILLETNYCQYRSRTAARNAPAFFNIICASSWLQSWSCLTQRKKHVKQATTTELLSSRCCHTRSYNTYIHRL